MNKIILLIFLVFNSNLFAQKFGYVNSEFILNNMKEYKEAMSEIESLSKAWEKEISDMYIEIEKKEIELKYEELEQNYLKLKSKIDVLTVKKESETKKELEFSDKIDELNQETDSLLEEIDKWQI